MIENGEEIVRVYEELQKICPSHELLNYIKIKNKSIEFPEDNNIAMDFVTRFGKGKPNPKIKQSFQEYQKTLVKVVFGNYLSSLEQAVNERLSLN